MLRYNFIVGTMNDFLYYKTIKRYISSVKYHIRCQTRSALGPVLFILRIFGIGHFLDGRIVIASDSDITVSVTCVHLHDNVSMTCGMEFITVQ